jgi:hypothetical protein
MGRGPRLAVQAVDGGGGAPRELGAFDHLTGERDQPHRRAVHPALALGAGHVPVVHESVQEASRGAYDDLKVIEAHTFLESVLEGRRRAPGTAEALAVAEVLSAMERSCDSAAWEDVAPLAVQTELAP